MPATGKGLNQPAINDFPRKFLVDKNRAQTAGKAGIDIHSIFKARVESFFNTGNPQRYKYSSSFKEPSSMFALAYGKGAAVLTGLANAVGEFVIIQDADLEYEPADYLKLINAMKDKNADIVLGVRFQKGYHGLFMHRLGNRILTGLINLLFDAKLNDSYTCYKLLRRDTINTLSLQSRSFDIDAEIVVKALKKRLRIAEIPISYHPRTYAEGKKIRWNDGVHGIFSIIKYWMS